MLENCSLKDQISCNNWSQVCCKRKTVLSGGCAVKTDLSSVPEERTEETDQPTNQQPALTGLARQRANQCAAVAFTLAPIPKQMFI